MEKNKKGMEEEVNFKIKVENKKIFNRHIKTSENITFR